MSEYLSPSYFFDFDDPAIIQLVEEFKNPNLTNQKKASRLYQKVRDGWRYNPYKISFKPENSKASVISKKTEGHCVDKSILLIAGLRKLGIPARIHLAKVKNHIAVERLIEKFGTNELTPHGMADVFLNGKWVKCSPAFNVELCIKCNVSPLDFDGTEDSVFHEYDQSGAVFMEYIEDYGHFEDLPLTFIHENMRSHYPIIAKKILDNQDIFI